MQTTVSISSSLLWRFIAVVAAATACAMVAARLSLDWASTLLPASACLMVTPLSRFYRDRDERIALALDSAAQLIAFSVINEILSNVVATADHPLWDHTLNAWDGAVGLNWSAYLDFVNARPWLDHLFLVAYQSLLVQIVVVLIALSFQGKPLACRRFVLAFMISCFTTVVVFWLVPAMGIGYDLDFQHTSEFRNLVPVGTIAYLKDLSALREGTVRVISLKDPQGIVSFPSFHAALGVIFASALWNCRWLRWPGIALNIVLIAATPIVGGHYFIDVLAGAGIGVLSMAFAHALGPRVKTDPHIALATEEK